MDREGEPQAAERDALQRAALRATRPRLDIYQLLREVGGHRSVDELVALLAERGAGYPRTTVYNVMADLLAAGLIMCADAGPGRALYEARDDWHHHFVCRQCGQVYDVPCVHGAKPCLELPPSALPGRIDEAQIIFRGICDRCRDTAGE